MSDHLPAQLPAIAQQALEHALKLGASNAQVQLSQGNGLSLNLRQDRIRARREEAHISIALTVYHGHCRGTTHSTDFSEASLQEMARAACDIATHTTEDPHAGLAELSTQAHGATNLRLYHPWSLSASEAQALAQRIEQGVSLQGKEVQSDGAWVSSYQSLTFIANSLGFASGYEQSLHSLTASALATREERRHLGNWQCQRRDPEQMEHSEQIGERAAKRALAYLNEKPIQTGRYSILFDPHMAITLLMDFVSAASGRPLLTCNSYLEGRLQQGVMADHLSVQEDPYIPGGLASAPFDSDGIAGQQRLVVERGRLRGYFLSAYSGRHLGLPSTGNASGPYNLSLSSLLTRSSDDQPAMLAKLERGLLITELGGESSQLLTGNYSRTAKGFWVEKGTIIHAVNGITLSGNLDTMLKQIVAVGTDTITQGPFTCGSLLLESLHVGAT